MTKNLRKIIITAALAAGIVTAVVNLYTHRNPPKPNVIIILLDAARPDRFSCYGYQKQTTPFIDSIAKSGMTFRNHFACSTMTHRSLPQLFSSRYFSKEMFGLDGGIWNIHRATPNTITTVFDPQQTTIQNVLALNGYRTAIFAQHVFIHERSYLATSFQEYFELPYILGENRAEIMGNMIAPITEWLSKNKKHRFFAYIHLMFPHEPYPADIESRQFLIDSAGNPLPDDICARTRLSLKQRPQYSNANPGMDNIQLQCLSGLYDSNLRFADDIVCALYDTLEKTGMSKNTLLIITSDHGENLGEHGLIGHGSLPWDTVLRIPLIMMYRGVIPAGSSYEGFTETVDIMPTILGACRIKAPPGKTMDGIDVLSPAARGLKKNIYTVESIRTERYKYMMNKSYLFDLVQDPGETRNIFSSKPKTVRQLKDQFLQKTTPLMQRFRNAVNLAQPKQPFYYPVSVCNIVSPEVTPGDTESMKRQLMRTEGGGTPNGDCVILNTSTNAEQIRFMPDARTNFELSIESSVPSGRYTIALLCSTDKAVPDLRSLSPLRYRFDSDSPYVASSTYTPFTANQESEEDTQQPYYYYALLSETTVRDNKFSLQIDLRNPAKAPDAIHQIIFFPVNHDTPAKSVRENIDFRERLKKIRLFGYMQ